MSDLQGRRDGRPNTDSTRATSAYRLYFAYALPAAPLACLGLPLYALVPTYYTETIGLPLASVGLVLLFIRFFDAAIDPVVGVLSDRFRPLFGRRRLALLISLPVASLAAFMLYWPPADANIAWLGLWGILLSLGFTMATVPYAAWGAELVTGYRERSSLAAWREGLTLIGTLIAIVLPFGIGFGKDQAVSGLAWLGIVIAISLPLTGLITIAVCPEPKEYSTTRLSLKQSVGFLFGNTSFLRLLAAFFLNGFANGIPATLFLYFVSDRSRSARSFALPVFSLRNCRRSTCQCCCQTLWQTPRLVPSDDRGLPGICHRPNVARRIPLWFCDHLHSDRAASWL